MIRRLILAGLSVVVIILLVVTILLFTGPRMKYQPSVGSFELKMPLPPDDAVSFNHRKFDPKNISFPLPTEENLTKGKVYYTYYCVFCHGIDGKGNGDVGKSYTPRPADLKNAAGITDIGELYKKSFTGVGHSPVLERIVPSDHRVFILTFLKEEFK